MGRIYLFLIVLILNFNFALVIAQDFENLKDYQLFNVQLHIHGHSHHNASSRPGSIQLHTHQASENNVDILWFSEHDGMLNQNHDLLIDFNEANVDESGNINFNRKSNFLPEYFEKNVSNGISKIDILNDSTIFLELNHLFGNEAILQLSPRTSNGKLAGFRLPRPISSQAILRFNMKGNFGGFNNFVKVIVDLSWHFSESPQQHKIEYIFSVPSASSAVKHRSIRWRTSKNSSS